MSQVLSTDTTVQGLDFELGLHAELPYGIRLFGSFEVIWYRATYSGERPHLPDGSLWSDVLPGEYSNDVIIRFRLGAGWAF